MEFEKEITVEVNTSLEKLIEILENKGFVLKETYDVNDVYLINKNDKEGDYLTMLNKCVLIRDIIEDSGETKMLTYKYKEYNDKKEITKQGKIKVKIDDVENAKSMLEHLNFEELIRINDHMLVYATDNEEMVIQYVNDGKHIYIEVEDECHYANRVYKSIEEMKEVITKNDIPIKGDNFFAKKAEDELKEIYDKKD